MENSIITLKNVTVSLDRRPILEDLDLSIGRGERVLINGRNGAGKTTLLKMLLGLIKPDKGRIEVFGFPIGSRNWLESRKKIGYLNQESILVDLPISAYEVAEIGTCRLPLKRKERRDVVREAMGQAGCLSLKNRSYVTLSGGEKQKVSLARCLGQKPSILLLDEPTSFLDPDAKDEILNILEGLNRNKQITLLMVSHDLALIRREDWLTMSLVQGRFGEDPAV